MWYWKVETTINQEHQLFLTWGIRALGSGSQTVGHAWRGRHGCGSHNEEYTCRKVGFSMYCESVRRWQYSIIERILTSVYLATLAHLRTRYPFLSWGRKGEGRRVCTARQRKGRAVPKALGTVAVGHDTGLGWSMNEWTRLRWMSFTLLQDMQCDEIISKTDFQ